MKRMQCEERTSIICTFMFTVYNYTYRCYFVKITFIFRSDHDFIESYIVDS